VLGVLMVTSKGSAGVTGSGFITLAATLATMGKIPVAGMVLLLGVDRFMSEARSITNTIGNAVGTVAIAKWVGASTASACTASSTARTPIAVDGVDRRSAVPVELMWRRPGRRCRKMSA
jgi:aerobic C4-dicarboxylate transport protein